MKKIKLNGKLGEGKYAIVDDSDWSLVSKYRWYLLKLGYVVRSVGRNKKQFLHREIMQPPKGFEVDHINGDRLDNRRAKLRICTHSQNGKNLKKRKNNKFGLKGVGWARREQMYRARIMVNYKDIHLGYFHTVKDAAKAYNEAARQYFGEYARLNQI